MASYYYNKNSKLWSVRFLCFENGKRVYKRISGFAKKSDAIDHYTLVINQYNSGQTKQADFNPLVSTLFSQYIVEQNFNVKESTTITKQTAFKNHILPYLENVKIKEVDKIWLHNWQTQLWNKNLSHKYKKTIRSFLNHFLNWVANLYEIQNKLQFVKAPKRLSVKKEMLFWTMQEFNHFLTAFETEQNITFKTLFMFQFFTGNRIGETLALTDNDILGGFVNITKNLTRKTLDGSTYKIIATKNYVARKTPIPELLQNQLDLYMAFKSQNNLSSEFLFCGDKPLAENTIRRVFNHYTATAGIKRIRIHDLRHSYVSMLLHSGINNKVIASLIGDREEQVIKTYSHLYETDKSTAINTLSKSLKNIF